MWNLLRATEHNPPKAIVGFSSVAGRFGNAGQTDYSTGNDLLCKIASWWGAAHPESLAMVFDWTAWGGIGMATRGSIPEIMKRAGIEMLEPSEAIPIVRESLTRGLSSEAVVGRTLGILVAKRHETGGIDPVRLGQPGASGLTFGTPNGICTRACASRSAPIRARSRSSRITRSTASRSCRASWVSRPSPRSRRSPCPATASRRSRTCGSSRR